MGKSRSAATRTIADFTGSKFALSLFAQLIRYQLVRPEFLRLQPPPPRRLQFLRDRKSVDCDSCDCRSLACNSCDCKLALATQFLSITYDLFPSDPCRFLFCVFQSDVNATQCPAEEKISENDFSVHNFKHDGGDRCKRRRRVFEVLDDQSGQY